MAAEAAAAGGASARLPGWEFFTPVAGAGAIFLTLVPRWALPVDVGRRWCATSYRSMVEQARTAPRAVEHPGTHVSPEDIYLRPENSRGLA